MIEQIITIFCICDDYILQSKGVADWHNVKMSTSEVMTVFLIAAKFFSGNIALSKAFLQEHGYMPKMLSLSALIRRIHAINQTTWEGILEYIHEWRQASGLSTEYIVDSFPVAVCKNIRIRDCRIYQSEEFRRYNKSKREYFFGLKVTVVVTRDGCPFRVILCPGREHDITPFKIMKLGLPKGSELYGDSAYLDYEHEEKLKNEEGIRLIAHPKTNSLRPIRIKDFITLKHIRGMIESSFGVISRLLPKKIHAVTSAGFEIKVLGFVIAFAIRFIMIYLFATYVI